MSDSRPSKELISELRALDLPGVAPIARAAAAEIERLQATNVPKNGDVYLALVRSGYSQHEAHEIASMVESMQCQRHDCEVMRDELQELRAVHEPKNELPFLRDFDGNPIRQMSQAEYDAMYGDEGATVPPSAAQPAIEHEAAMRAACTFLLERFENEQCDSEGVSDCVRCNVVVTARRLLKAMDRATVPPREGYSQAYADQMRTALLRIAGWREIDRNSLGERLREIEEIALAALMPTVTKLASPE